MNIQQMHILIDEGIQKLGYLNYRSLETEQIDLQINKQINRFIDNIVDIWKGARTTGMKQGVQKSVPRLDDLRTLQVKNLEISLSNFGTHKQGSLPNYYRHYISFLCDISYQCIENKVLITKTETNKNVRVVETQNLEYILSSAFYKPTKKSSVIDIAGNTVYLYNDGVFTHSKLFINYIKKPAVVLYNKDGNGDFTSTGSVDCDLPENTHYTIVDMTVKHIGKILESNPQKIVNLENEPI